MSLYNGPARGGNRGGKDQFNWDNVKADKDREYYLGHSVKATTGRWQKGKDVFWYTRAKGDGTDPVAAEVQSVKEREEELMLEALGMKPKVKKLPVQPKLDQRELAQLTQRGEDEDPGTLAAEDRLQGIGYQPRQSEGQEEREVLAGTSGVARPMEDLPLPPPPPRPPHATAGQKRKGSEGDDADKKAEKKAEKKAAKRAKKEAKQEKKAAKKAAKLAAAAAQPKNSEPSTDDSDTPAGRPLPPLAYANGSNTATQHLHHHRSDISHSREAGHHAGQDMWGRSRSISPRGASHRPHAGSDRGRHRDEGQGTERHSKGGDAHAHRRRHDSMSPARHDGRDVHARRRESVSPPRRHRGAEYSDRRGRGEHNDRGRRDELSDRRAQR